MEMRNLGRSGLRVSLVGLGCNMLGVSVDEAAAKPLLHAALDLGINFFDVADIYGEPRGAAETILGRAIAGCRDEVVLATKGGFSVTTLKPMGASRRYLVQALEASLRRLGTDHVDLYQIHTYDGATPVEETLRALEDLIHAGKVRYYGASNLTAWQAVDAGWTARHLGVSGYVSVQNEYNLLQRHDDVQLLPALDRAGAGLIPYSPLANGLLTGKYRGGIMPDGSRLAAMATAANKTMTAQNMAAVERLAHFAAARGRKLTELAMSWLAARPQVATIIAGARLVEQLRENVAAVGWAMTAAEVAEAEALAGPVA